MQVKVFHVEPINDPVQEVIGEVTFEALCDELNLPYQKAFVSKNPENPTFMPYPVMDEDEMFVYQYLMPETQWLKFYSDDAIPPRVLQEAIKAKQFFTGDSDLLVWYPKAGRKNDDPMLVGTKGNKTYKIARWGDELKTYDELKREVARRVAARLA